MISTITLDSDELGHALTVLEIVEMCHQVCAHIFRIISVHYGSDSIEKLTLDRMSAGWHFRLGLLGRHGCRNTTDYISPDIEVTRLIISIGESSSTSETITTIKHNLTHFNLSHICPDTLLDYLLVLLQESMKSMLPKVPNELNYTPFGQDCLSAARDLVSQLRRFVSRIPGMPTRDPNCKIVGLLIEVALPHHIPERYDTDV